MLLYNSLAIASYDFKIELQNIQLWIVRSLVTISWLYSVANCSANK